MTAPLTNNHAQKVPQSILSFFIRHNFVRSHCRYGTVLRLHQSRFAQINHGLSLFVPDHGLRTRIASVKCHTTDSLHREGKQLPFRLKYSTTSHLALLSLDPLRTTGFISVSKTLRLSQDRQPWLPSSKRTYTLLELNSNTFVTLVPRELLRHIHDSNKNTYIIIGGCALQSDQVRLYPYPFLTSTPFARLFA